MAVVFWEPPGTDSIVPSLPLTLAARGNWGRLCAGRRGAAGAVTLGGWGRHSSVAGVARKRGLGTPVQSRPQPAGPTPPPIPILMASSGPACCPVQAQCGGAPSSRKPTVPCFSAFPVLRLHRPASTFLPPCRLLGSLPAAWPWLETWPPHASSFRRGLLGQDGGPMLVSVPRVGVPVGAAWAAPGGALHPPCTQHPLRGTQRFVSLCV